MLLPQWVARNLFPYPESHFKIPVCYSSGTSDLPYILFAANVIPMQWTEQGGGEETAGTGCKHKGGLLWQLPQHQ